VSWHADARVLDGYADGSLGGASVYSVEAHLAGCPRCRGELSKRVDSDRLDRVWGGVRRQVEAPRRDVVERALAGLGVPAHTARVLVATPSLRPSWILAVATSLAFAVLAGRLVGGGNLPFLVLAPLVPVLGVAVAFARPIDPLWEISATTPTGGFRLTMIRAAAVITASIVPTALAALGLPEPGWIALAWLLPALGLTLLTLALSAGAATTPAVAGVVAATWAVGVVVAGQVAADPLAAFATRGQVLLAAIAAAAAVVVASRRDAFERSRA
jgi:putative zinc finger protein